MNGACRVGHSRHSRTAGSEREEEGSLIPDVCDAFGVRYQDPFSMYMELGRMFAV